jgi:exonuclease V gamma subunit
MQLMRMILEKKTVSPTKSAEMTSALYTLLSSFRHELQEEDVRRGVTDDEGRVTSPY